MSPYREALKLGIAIVAIASTAFAAKPPSVVYETTIPGYYIAHARDIVVDGAGNSYLIGSAYEDQHSLDVLVVKIDATGDVAWQKYIVSSAHNYATGIALDGANDVWVTGWTDSPDFPLVNPMDSTFQAREVFLMKLANADGSILYSTFIGGDYADRGEGIALNVAGEIWLTGRTGSTDFPVTADAYQGEPNFPLYFFSDAFLMKLSPTGDAILYSTYFGGLEDDQATDIALDSAGNPVIVGDTSADDFPLVNELQSAQNELFLAKFSADGHTLLFSSYFGGEDLDRIGGIAIDRADHLCLVGSTRSVQFPTTPGAFQEDFVGGINACEVPFGADYNCEDIFVTEMATDGTGLVWSTYLGGSYVEEGRDIAVDTSGRVYVTGYTTSSDFPGTDAPPLTGRIIVSRLDATGSELDFTHAVESGSANRGNGITIDALGAVYFTGTLGVPASVYVSKLGGELGTTGITDAIGTSVALSLSPGAPNPFRPSTRFEYAIPQNATPVNLRVYDVRGQLVRELMNGVQTAGRHSATWDGSDSRGDGVHSGVYFVRLDAAGAVRTQKVVKLTN